MRKIIIGIILVGIAFWLVVKKGELRALKDDFTASKKMAVIYSGQTRIVDDGLKSLVGDDGEVEWSGSEIINSEGNDAAEVKALVTGVNSKGQPHTASFIFYINHTTKQYSLEHVSLDGKSVNLKEGFKLIVTGSFD